jgi:uncharacterized repeat protein (TIGR03803 family)
MGNTLFARSLRRFLSLCAAITMLAGAASAANPIKVIYSFSGDTDGEYLDTDLVIDKAGNLYGTSVQGGDFGSGTVFELAPTANGWAHTVLYSFRGGRDGGEPYKGVTLDSQGNLYGTAVTGGTGACEGGCGVVYKLTNSGGVWTQSVIHHFLGTDGSGPGSPVTFDKAGNLYGMTPTGGADGFGVVYRLKLRADGSWGLRVLHTFTGGNDGASGSAGRMIFDGAGNLYSVATAGGANGAGVAFELSPTKTGEWTQTILYQFKGQPDAGFPYGGLVFDAAGNLYGTSYYDGANNLGSVYKLTNTNGVWSESVLYSFQGGADGNNPISTLIFDASGRHLYGTNSQGGAACGCGTVFTLTLRSDGSVTESVIHRFRGNLDGAFVYNGMVTDGAGNFYGATVHGGPTDDGTIYEFTP